MDEKSCGLYEYDGKRTHDGNEYIVFGSTVLGRYFTSGQCAAYASGTRDALSLRISEYGRFEKYFSGTFAAAGDGYRKSKEEAEKKAMDNCTGPSRWYDPDYMHTVTYRSHTCKIRMSACIK